MQLCQLVWHTRPTRLSRSSILSPQASSHEDPEAGVVVWQEAVQIIQSMIVLIDVSVPFQAVPDIGKPIPQAVQAISRSKQGCPGCPKPHAAVHWQTRVSFPKSCWACRWSTSMTLMRDNTPCSSVIQLRRLLCTTGGSSAQAHLHRPCCVLGLVNVFSAPEDILNGHLGHIIPHSLEAHTDTQV